MQNAHNFSNPILSNEVAQYGVIRFSCFQHGSPERNHALSPIINHASGCMSVAGDGSATSHQVMVPSRESRGAGEGLGRGDRMVRRETRVMAGRACARDGFAGRRSAGNGTRGPLRNNALFVVYFACGVVSFRYPLLWRGGGSVSHVCTCGTMLGFFGFHRAYEFLHLFSGKTEWRWLCRWFRE